MVIESLKDHDIKGGRYFDKRFLFLQLIKGVFSSLFFFLFPPFLFSFWKILENGDNPVFVNMVF